MHGYDAMFSADEALKAQVAAEVFDTLSERGPILALMDRGGNCWSSHPELFATLGPGPELLEDLWAKVDDGAEPATAQIGDTTVMVAQLATEQTNCGYLVLVVPRSSAEWAQINLDLVEALFGQVTLIAQLFEKSRCLNEAQARTYSVYGTASAPAN